MQGSPGPWSLAQIAVAAPRAGTQTDFCAAQLRAHPLFAECKQEATELQEILHFCPARTLNACGFLRRL